MCVCVCVCVCERERERVCACMSMECSVENGSDSLSLGRTFLYDVTCIIKCIPYCSHFACIFLQPTSNGELGLKAAEVFSG